MRPSTTLSINPTPFRPSLLSIPPSPFSPLSPLSKSPPLPSPHEPTSSFSSSSSSASTDSLPSLSTSTSRSTSPSDSPSRPYASPPPPNPLHWLWQCYQCRQTYALGITRRCLEDGHFFCAGTTTVSKKGSKKRQRKHGSGCASEFDYVGWAAWGVWRRTEVRLRDSGLDGEGGMMYRESKAGSCAKTLGFEDGENKKNCWYNCDYPSECRWGRTMITGKTGQASTASTASASMSKRGDERAMQDGNDGAVQVVHEEYADTSPTSEAFEDAIMELEPLSRVSSTAEMFPADTPALAEPEILPATTFDDILARNSYNLQPITEWNAQQEALQRQQQPLPLSPLTNASAWAKKAKEDFWKSVIDSALLRRRLSGGGQDARDEGMGLASGLAMPVPLLGPYMGVPLSPVSEDEEADLGVQKVAKVGKAVRFAEVGEAEDIRWSDSSSSSSEEGEEAGEDTFSVGSDSDESCSTESSSDGEDRREVDNGAKEIRSPYLRTTPRNDR